MTAYAPREWPLAEAPATAGETWRELLGRVYFTFDRRTLAMTRIWLGLYLVFDLVRRTPDWLDMFSDTGILPAHVVMRRPQADNFTLFYAFHTPGPLAVLWAICLVSFLALLVGYKTKAAQVASLFLVTSMNGRVLLIENGGYVVENLLVLWTCFMPLGDRFSLDAMIASMRRSEADVASLADRDAMIETRRTEPFVSLVVFAVLLQLTAIYFFNVVHKTGPAWHDGTAVHYVLYNDRMATPLIPIVRDHLPVPVIKFLTKTAMVFEAALPVCLLSPLGVPWARRGVVLMMCTLHIAFGTTFTLGPFAWACCVFSTLMFTSADWDVAHRTMRRARRARTVLLREGSRAALWIGRVLARLDLFELLTFRASPDVAGAFEVVLPSGDRRQGADALADIVAALPLGPLVAWKPRLPGLRVVCDRLVTGAASPRVEAWFGAPPPATIELAPPSPLGSVAAKARVGLRELLVALMLATAVNQALVELWVARPLNMPQPQPFRALSHQLRFLQGWFMFSPNPVMDDGILVCDAETASGRHVDPFTGKPPRFALDGDVQFNQIWQDYMNRIQLPANSAYREALKDWLLRYHERTGRPQDRIVAARAVWVHEMNPRIGQTKKTHHEEREILVFDTRTGKSQIK